MSDLHVETFLLVKKHHSDSSQQPFSPNSICSVPTTLRSVNPKAYTPSIMSIGLNHRSTTGKFESMHEQKAIYMSSLFYRASQHEEKINKYVDRCVDAMIKMAVRARICYPPSFHSLDLKIIAQAMLLDGCFILELLLRGSSDFTTNKLKLNCIKHDLLLLENQIPFFVLEELFRLTVQWFTQDPLCLNELILEFFGNILNPHFKLKLPMNKGVDVDHILGLLHSCYQPQKSCTGDYMITKYCATELHRSGVNFKPSEKNEEVYLNIEFHIPCLFYWFNTTLPYFFKTIFPFARTKLLPVTQKPRQIKCCALYFMCELSCRAILEIPQLCITDSTESFMRNLIAYEQCSQNTPRYITSYAFLMDTLINSEEHVELLETSGVLKNYLGTAKNASNLFNSLCKEVDLGEFCFWKEWEDADAYCRLYWPSCIASLRRTYFGNPWAGISLFAALLLFVFTGIQTYCSITAI